MKTVKDDGTCGASCDVCGYKPLSCKECRILHDPERMEGTYCSIECYRQSEEYRKKNDVVITKKDTI